MTQEKKAHQIDVKLTTKSNLFIGGSSVTFEIGGVDLFTVTDVNGLPYIPGSSLKGVLRNMVRELLSEELEDIQSETLLGQAEKIGKWYRSYLEMVGEEQKEQLSLIKENERKESAIQRMNAVIDCASAEYLFGIEGFNNTPKLLFNDLVVESPGDPKDLFSIDSKNSVTSTEDKNGREIVMANPRSYCVVRPGVSFTGSIVMHRMNLLGGNEASQEINKFIQQLLLQFNEGVYRLGNSGSRGYGRVQVDIIKGE